MVKNILQEHNAQAIKTLTEYTTCFVTAYSHELGPDKLPFSDDRRGADIQVDEVSLGEDVWESLVITRLCPGFLCDRPLLLFQCIVMSSLQSKSSVKLQWGVYFWTPRWFRFSTSTTRKRLSSTPFSLISISIGKSLLLCGTTAFRKTICLMCYHRTFKRTA